MLRLVEASGTKELRALAPEPGWAHCWSSEAGILGFRCFIQMLFVSTLFLSGDSSSA